MDSRAVCVDNPSPADVEFTVCARLLRALSHMIRGDLSVVTNDLTYLRSVAPPEELERPRARCSSAAATLARVNIITNGVVLGGIPLAALIHELGGSPDEHMAVIRGDVSKLSWLGRTLRTLFGVITVEGVSCLPQEDVLIDCGAAPPRFGNPQRGAPDQVSFSAVSDYLAPGLGEREIVEAALLDLLFQAFGWRVRLETDHNHVSLRLRVPREGKGGRAGE